MVDQLAAVRIFYDNFYCTEKTIEHIKEPYQLKDDSVGPLTRYLGVIVGKFQLKSGLECWSALARDYVKSAVWNMEQVLSQDPIPSKLRN